ncbi:MAG: hypothetical protein IJL53_08815 [Firmicutes bacterium]|nr:hypothetical protein [Bacillota bacterium]
MRPEWTRILGSRKLWIIWLVILAVVFSFAKIQLDTATDPDDAETAALEYQQYLDAYPSYLDEVRQRADEIQSNPLFAEPGSISYLIAGRTREDYARIDPDLLEAVPITSWNILFGQGIEEAALLIICFTVVFLITDKQKSRKSLLMAYSGGRLPYALQHLVVLLCTAVISVVSVYGCKTLVAVIWGGGFLQGSAPVQSVPMFRECTLAISLDQMAVLFLCAKALAMFLLGIILWIVFTASSHWLFSIAVLGILFGTEYLLYRNIGTISSLALFRQANLMQCFRTQDVFTRSDYLVFGQKIVSVRGFLLVLTPVLIAALAVVGLVCDCRRPGLRTPRILRWLDKVQQRIQRASTVPGLFRNELRKGLWVQSGIWILIALVLARIFWYDPVRLIPLNTSEFALESLYKQLEGPVTEDKITYLQDSLDKAEAEILEYMSSVDAGGDSTKLLELEEKAGVIRTVLTEAEEKLARQGETGITAYLLPQNDYRKLLDPLVNAFFAGQESLLALGVLILCLAWVGAYEQNQNMNGLFRSYGADRKVLRAKILYILLIAFLTWTAVYLRQLPGREYPLPEAPVQNLNFMKEWGLRVSIRGWLILLYLYRLIILCLTGLLIGGISSRCQNTLWAFLLAAVLLLVPGVLQLAGMISCRFPTAMSILDGNLAFLSGGIPWN